MFYFYFIFLHLGFPPTPLPESTNHIPGWRTLRPIGGRRPHGQPTSGEVSGERSQRQRSAAAAVPVSGRVRVRHLCYCTQPEYIFERV